MRRIFYVAMMTMLLSLSLTGQSPAEEVTITTYYPAPYGAYTDLTATNLEVSADLSAGSGMLDIDTTNNDISLAVTTGDITMAVPSGSSVTITGGGTCDVVNTDFNLTGTSNMAINAGNLTLGTGDLAVTSGGATVGGNFICFGSIATTSLAATGAIAAGTTKPVNGHFGHLFDLAEDIMAPNCESGDVVVIDPDNDAQVIPSSKAYETSVAGVISIKPAFQIGKIAGGKPLALVGRVMCKVTTENGPIKRGDLLVTSSQPAHAMRADPKDVGYGMVLGKALQELAEGDGEILILVRPN